MERVSHFSQASLSKISFSFHQFGKNFGSYKHCRAKSYFCVRMIVCFFGSCFGCDAGEQEAVALPCPSPPTQALALDAWSSRKYGGVTIDGLEIADVTEVIGGGREMGGESQLCSEFFGFGDWSAVFNVQKKNPNFVLLA